MEINILFEESKIDFANLLMLRHTPKPSIKKELPYLAEIHPSAFNNYQQTQSSVESEKRLAKAAYVAAFIGETKNQAVFVGIYRNNAHRIITSKQYWRMPSSKILRQYGESIPAVDLRPNVLWFDLQPLQKMQHLKGKLVIEWPAPTISWMRWAQKGAFPICAILEESRFIQPLSDWKEIVWSWNKLQNLPRSWQEALKHWRAIYLIHDRSDGKNYVGSASGKYNLLGRWINYRDKHDGGNVLLKNRKPENLQFSILERVSPDMTKGEVINLETSWKLRLHTHAPSGLNLN